MRVHICLYLNKQEVININDVKDIEFMEKAHIVVITTDIRQFIIHENKFDRIEVDFI